jgi:type IV secretory pathway TrbL component
MHTLPLESRLPQRRHMSTPSSPLCGVENGSGRVRQTTVRQSRRLDFGPVDLGDAVSKDWKRHLPVAAGFAGGLLAVAAAVAKSAEQEAEAEARRRRQSLSSSEPGG